MKEIKQPTLISLEERLCWLHAYGYNTLSFLSLYPGFSYFSIEGVDGYIPYVQSSGLILGAGDPICGGIQSISLVDAFIEHFKEKVGHIGFIPVSSQMNIRLQEKGFDQVYIGQEGIFDLQHLKKPRSTVREAVNRAQRRKLRVVQMKPSDRQYEENCQALFTEWIHTKMLPPLGYLFELKPFILKEYKKYFLLLDEQGRLLAFLACSPIYARNGWYLQDLIRGEDMPSGGTELLVMSALQILRQEGYTMATQALALLSALPEQNTLHPKLNQTLMFVYRHFSQLYHFETLERFKKKFCPNTFEENYFCFYPPGVSIPLVRSLVSILLPGGVPAIIRYKIEKWRSNLK